MGYKRTNVSAHEAASMLEQSIATRIGRSAQPMGYTYFAPTYMYGSLVPELGEVGAIFRYIGHGKTEVIERIFVNASLP